MARRIVPVTLCTLWCVAVLSAGGCSKEQPPDDKTTSAVAPHEPGTTTPAESDNSVQLTPEIKATPINIDITEAKKEAEALGMPKNSMVLSKKGDEIRIAVPVGSGKDIKKAKFVPSAATTEAAEAIVEAWKNIHSLSAHVASTADQEDGVFRHTEGQDGTYDFMKRDGVNYMRQYLFQKVALKRPTEGRALTGQRVEQWYDGEDLYVVHEFHKDKYWTKIRQNPAKLEYLGGTELIWQIGMNDKFDVQDTLRDGLPVYLFTGSKAEGRITTEYYVDKKTGMLVHTKVVDKIAKRELTLTFSDFKINPSFEKDHFTFTPPDGLRYVDYQKAISGQAFMGPPAPAEPSTP